MAQQAAAAAAVAAAQQRSQQQQSATLIAANVDVWPGTDDENGVRMLLEVTSVDGEDRQERDSDLPVAMIDGNQHDPAAH
eukprot:9498116-Pyramimonas_sp.AAC.1